MTGRRIDAGHWENSVRKKVGLPECDQLIFYTVPRDANSKEDVISWEIEKEYEEYYVLRVQTETKVFKLHAGMLAFMQAEEYEPSNCFNGKESAYED